MADTAHQYAIAAEVRDILAAPNTGDLTVELDHEHLIPQVVAKHPDLLRIGGLVKLDWSFGEYQDAITLLGKLAREL